MVGDFSTRAPWKRSACDRCRSQKLRCYRDEGRPLDACHRCVKSGSNCVTSMARPTGRPPSRRPVLADPNDLSTSSETNNMSPADSSMNNADVNDSNSNNNNMTTDNDLPHDSFMDSISMSPTDPILGNNLDDILLFSQHTTSLPDPSPHAMIPQHPRAELVSSSSSSSSQSVGSAFQFSNSLLDPRLDHTHLGLPAYNTNRVETLLSQLHLELCNLLFYVLSTPWDVQDTLRLTICPETYDSQDGDGGETQPLVQVAKALRGLERILNSLRPSKGATEHSPLTFSYHSLPSSIRTTQLLLALSCYIQVVSIYDNIFSAVFEYLASGGPAMPLAAILSSEQEPSTPTLYLGGLAILPNRKLCGTLLVHQIEHQLERSEMLLGLPEHYRITSKSGDSGKDMASGLFGGQHGQTLLNAAFQAGDFRSGEHDIRCFRSLKRKMRQIKDL